MSEYKPKHKACVRVPVYGWMIRDVDYKKEVQELAESLDELLVACKLLCIEKKDISVHSIIERAEAIKKKEAYE